MSDNFVNFRHLEIIKQLITFFPNVIANLISTYDYYFEGKLCENCFLRHSITVHDKILLADGRLIINTFNGEFVLIDVKESIEHNIIFKGSPSGHSRKIYCAALLSDGQHEMSGRTGRIITGSGDKTLKIWNLQTQTCDTTFTGHSDVITCVAELHDGPSGCFDQRIISGSKDNTLKIWNRQTGNCVISLVGHSREITCFAELSSNRIISGSYDGMVKIWNIPAENLLSKETLQLACDITCPLAIFESIRELHDGRIIGLTHSSNLVIFNSEFKYLLWNSYEKIHNINDYTCKNCHIVTCFTLLPDGRIVFGLQNGLLKIWNPLIEECDISFKSDNKPSIHVSVLPNGQLVSIASNGSYSVWS
jgi:WD40 repeat protein